NQTYRGVYGTSGSNGSFDAHGSIVFAPALGEIRLDYYTQGNTGAKGLGSTGTAIQSSAYFNVVTAPIPEPESYALLLAGLGLMGTYACARLNISWADIWPPIFRGCSMALITAASALAGIQWSRTLGGEHLSSIACASTAGLLAMSASSLLAPQLFLGESVIFALHDTELGFPPEWNKDPLTGRLAPLTPGKAIDYRRPELVGNIKYLWEPSRHLELVTLAQAWRLTSDEEYLNGFRTLLASWLDQCPYPLGVHWASSLELAVRLANWASAWHLLGGVNSPLFVGSDGEDLKRRWLASVYQHCHFISGYFSLHSSANNHLVGEYMGLFLGAVTWPCWPESADWLRIARNGLECEAIKQNTCDGVNREQALYYQHEVMTMLLLCQQAGQANGIVFSTAYLRRLECMAEFIVSVMDKSGNVPMIGDADDAQMLRLDHGTQHDVFRSLLASCAVLFKRFDFKRAAGVFDDGNRWLFGDAGLAAWNAIPDGDSSAPGWAFPEGGYFIFGSDFGTDAEIKGLVDCGPIGYPSIAAHGHADALSIWLSVCGEPCLIDPGTYSYWADQPWRDYFRGTAAHNTVRVDGLDQSVSGGRFLWTRKAVSRVLQSPVSPDVFHFEGMHDGYRRLADPVEHRRTVNFDAGTSTLVVTDNVIGHTQHAIEQFWHFSPEIEVTLSDNSATIRGNCFSMAAEFEGDDISLDLFCGSEQPILGWYSDSYENKRPATTLRVRTSAIDALVRASFRIDTASQISVSAKD
ncbi:MAG: alginate lyase family protein, partial [Flavobacteriales bacterium]